MEVQKLNPQNVILKEYWNLGTPNVLLRQLKMECNTWFDIFKSQHQTIGYLGNLNQDWKKYIYSYITTVITDFLKFVGRKETMDDQQIVETAILILKHKPNMKIDDIYYFFELCKIAYFGRLYDINGHVIFDWLNKYEKQRNDKFTYFEAEVEREKQRRIAAKKKEIEDAKTPEQRKQEQENVTLIINRIKKNLYENNNGKAV